MTSVLWNTEFVCCLREPMASVRFGRSPMEGKIPKSTQFVADQMLRPAGRQKSIGLRVAPRQLVGTCIHRSRRSIQCFPQGYQKVRRGIDYRCRCAPGVIVRSFRRRCVLSSVRHKAVLDTHVTDAWRRRSRLLPYFKVVRSLSWECSASETTLIHSDYQRKVAHLAHEDAQQPRRPSFTAPLGLSGHLPIMWQMRALHPEKPYP